MKYIDVSAEIKGADQVKHWLEKSPRYMTTEARRWFFDIRKRYVGIQNKKRLGTYTNWLKSKGLKYARGIGGTWSNPAVSAFKGFVRGSAGTGNMSLTMGTPPDSRSGFARGLENRATGNYNITSGQYMPVPMYKNLIRYGYTKNFRSLIRRFIGMNFSASGLAPFFPIKKNGVIFFVSRTAYKSGATLKRATFFKLTKSVVHPYLNFQFESKFEKQWPKYLQLGEKRMERAMRSLELGYVKS